MKDIILYVLLGIGVILDVIYILCVYHGGHTVNLITKSAASCAFVLIGGFCLLRAGSSPAGWLIFIGLIAGAAGDVLLNLRDPKGIFFKAGVVSFLCGHLLYIAAFFTFDPIGCLIALPIAVLLGFLFIRPSLKLLDVPSGLEILGPGYMGIVVWLFCCSAMVLIRTKLPDFYLLAPGSLLFLISDTTLCFRTFGRNKHKWQDALCLSTYYLSQTLIALSIWLPTLF